MSGNDGRLKTAMKPGGTMFLPVHLCRKSGDSLGEIAEHGKIGILIWLAIGHIGDSVRASVWASVEVRVGASFLKLELPSPGRQVSDHVYGRTN